jgi:glycosyltransferase involved in cell wall biosynthesis
MKSLKADVAIGLFTWNGEKYLSKTFQSLLNQSYRNFKIFVHHNSSTDSTIKIINQFKKKYPKKIFILDDKIKREIPDAIKILCKKKLKFYKYLMIVNDDDIYGKDFILKNIKNMKKYNLDLSYAPMKTTKFSKVYKNYPLYSHEKLYKNLFNFLFYRNPVPICFGVFKTKKFINNLENYAYFDDSKTNYDNVFIFSCLLNMKINFIREKIFTYRIKNRDEIALKRNFKYSFNDLIYQLLIFKFQYTFLKKILILVFKNKKINFIMKTILMFYMIFLYPAKVGVFLIKRNISKYF